MFIKTNDRIINLKNVSNINVLKNKNRIVFNLNYSIEIKIDDTEKYISDYVYWDCVDSSDLNFKLDYLSKNQYLQRNFIHNNNNGYININEIGSIKLSEKKNRIIFNLCHPVTFLDNDDVGMTSEFVYVNCKNQHEYKQYLNYINGLWE